MKILFALIALLGFGAVVEGAVLGPIKQPRTFDVVMIVAAGPEAHRYVLDTGLSLGDCMAALGGTEYNVQTVGPVEVQQSFSCER